MGGSRVRRVRGAMADAIPFNKTVKVRGEPQASPDERLAFQRLLFDLSSQFANLAGHQFESVTQTALSRIREFLGFERGTFAELLEDGSINVLATTAIEAVPPVAPGRLPLKLSWYHSKLLAGEMVIIHSLPDDLPPAAAAEAEHMRSINLKSHASIPIRVNGRLVGLIAFAAFRETRRWPVDLIGQIRLIGEIIAQAFER